MVGEDGWVDYYYFIIVVFVAVSLILGALLWGTYFLPYIYSPSPYYSEVCQLRIKNKIVALMTCV